MWFLSEKLHNSSSGINRNFLMVLSFTIKQGTVPAVRGTANQLFNDLFISYQSQQILCPSLAVGQREGGDMSHQLVTVVPQR